MMIDVPEENYLVDCQQPHSEIIDVTARTVWQSVDPMTREELAGLSLPQGLAPLGTGRGVMDAHYFRQSPGAHAPSRVRDRFIDGRRFIHCASPPANGPEHPIPGGPARLIVDKHHTIIFDAGRELNLIRNDSGTEFVQVIGASPDGGGLLQDQGVDADNFTLPEGWQLRTAPVKTRTVIDLPHPTEAWFFADGSSFQGPVTLVAAGAIRSSDPGA